ncbi:MAG: DNA polymerase III subunit delta' [Bergeyella sp.]
MNWQDIVGQEKLKNLLKESISDNRVSHAQLFTGKEGYGVFPLALAYAQEILAGENEHAASKVSHLNHLDLHFSFPVFSEKNNSLSKRCFEDFREMILENPYADFEDFTKTLQSENKQFFISADEVEAIGQQFSLKSFEGGTKILIVWRADKMNPAASNKFLKFLEEPPAKTIILLTAESADTILPTILSRTQIVEIPRIEDEDMLEALRKNEEADEAQLKEIVHQAQGNYNTALKLLHSGNSNAEFDALFVDWVRSAFMVKKKPEYLKNIIVWAKEIASWNREKQKSFLDYSAEVFRLALMQNYSSPELVYKKLSSNGFQWEKFSQYIHGANIESILEEVSTADYHLERNGNSKIVWTDLGIKLTRYIHRSAS